MLLAGVVGITLGVVFPTPNPAEKSVGAWAAYKKVHVERTSCEDVDEDGDGYVQCTVEDRGRKIPLACRYADYLGCHTLEPELGLELIGQGETSTSTGLPGASRQ